MKIVIIEDEKAAANNLVRLISDNIAQHEIVAILDSISESVEWFENNEMPDLVFMDIHLADGSSFEIFKEVEINCPIIFTTAFDEYALKAFKVNSIDYLLKPISTPNFKKAMDKFHLFYEKDEVRKQDSNNQEIVKLLKSFEQPQYKTCFLVNHKGTRIVPLSTLSIAFFYVQDGSIFATSNTNETYPINHSLDELSKLLDPSQFYRINRQFIISKLYIDSMELWFNNRMLINMKIPTPEKIIVSKNKVGEFKEWFI